MHTACLHIHIHLGISWFKIISCHSISSPKNYIRCTNTNNLYTKYIYTYMDNTTMYVNFIASILQINYVSMTTAAGYSQ